MRKAALLLVIAVFTCAANAQFSLQPRFGFESPVTKISYNNSSYFKPVSQFSAQAGVLANYQLKKGFAPFVGVFTHRPTVNYDFNDPKTGMTNYNASTGDLQLQFQAGLQYSTKAIMLTKNTSASKTKTENSSESKSSCYNHYCCHKKTNEAQTSKQQKDIWSLRLQPSAAIGYVPSGMQDMEIQNSSTQAIYTYNAGNIKTEFITGLGFEFIKNKKSFLTLNISYFKGLSNSETTFTTESDGKPLNTNISSKLSGWNVAIGIPISFAKKSSATKAQTKTHHSCSEFYRSRCSSYRKI